MKNGQLLNLKDVIKNIDRHKKELDTWKAKLTKIKGMYS